MLADHKARVSELLAQAKDKKQAAEALGELAQLAAKAELESVLVAALPQVIEAVGDKQKTTQAAAAQARRDQSGGVVAQRAERGALGTLPGVQRGRTSRFARAPGRR